ncbi:MAG: hypothetical protein F8N37_05810 [Telmatospirillum sp.]|nr:hypothetical protein [Telmatospirillum sp.]
MFRVRRLLLWLLAFLYLLPLQAGAGSYVLCRADSGHQAVEWAGHRHELSRADVPVAAGDAFDAGIASPFQPCADSPLLAPVGRDRGPSLPVLSVAPAVIPVFSPPSLAPPSFVRIGAILPASDGHPTLRHRRTVVLLS